MDESELSRAEEIAAYYKKLQSDENVSEKENADNAKDELEEEDTPEVIETEVLPDKSGKKNVFIIISAVCSAAILFAAFFLGVMYANPGRDADSVYLKLLRTDDKYKEVYGRSEEASSELDDAVRRLEQKQKEAEDLSVFVEQQAQIQQKIYELQEEYEAVVRANEEKQKTVNGLDAQAEKKVQKKVTLTPGIYCVGKHIASGNYSVTGDGSFNVSDGAGGFKQNASLTRDGTECGLLDGDILKLETTAVFERKDSDEETG